MKKLILAVALLGLAACSYSNDKSGSSNQTKRLEENNNRTSSNFGRIAGLYTGTLRTRNGDQKIQINLSILGKPDGTKNSDGTDRIVMSPAAAYIKIDPVGEPLANFSILYVPETGRLVMTNMAAKDIDEVHTIEATVIKTHMSGVVKTQAGSADHFELDLVANQSSSDPNGAQEEYKNRLREQYRALAGSYLGCVLLAQDGTTKVPYTTKMTLSFYDDSTDPKNVIPVLTGNFHRDTDKTDGTDSSLSGVYRPDLTPATLTIIGKPYIANNGYVSRFDMVTTADGFSGPFTSTKKGLEGNIFFKKGAYPAACASLIQK